MENITHDGIKIRHNIRVAVRLYLPYSFPESLQCCINIMLLELCHTLEVIESHLVRIVFYCRTADSDYLVVIFRLPDILDKGSPCTRIVRFYLNSLLIDTIDFSLRLLTKYHVCSLQHEDISILLWTSQCYREEPHDFGTVWIIVFLAACNYLTE